MSGAHSVRATTNFPSVIFVLGAFLIGWLIKSRVSIPPTVLKWGDRWVLDVALPILVISKMSRIAVDSTLVIPITVAWGSMGLCVLLTVLVGRVRQWDDRTVGAMLLVGVLGNTSFLGLGMVEGLLGSDHVASGLAYDQPGTFLALATYGSFIASRFGAGQWNLRAITSRLVRFMPFVALVLSIPVRAMQPSQQWYDIADTIGRTVAPVAMGLLGLRFTLRVSMRVREPAAVGLMIKMVVVPIAVVLVAMIAGDLDGTAWGASILQSAMPPMVTAGVVAIGAGLDEDLVVFMVGVGTLLSFASVPLMSFLL